MNHLIKIQEQTVAHYIDNHIYYCENDQLKFECFLMTLTPYCDFSSHFSK